MGIPAFYRWLVSRYPKAAVDVIEEKSTFVNGVRVPIDTTQPNPNGYEIDNLYLDMNGIVHPCFHPEDLAAPKTYDEVFKAVFKYIDRIFSIVRPRKLLYLAIDGVAPRAKMNQQRARRFRAAKDATDEASETETPSGIHEPEVGNVVTEKLDSNVITPGTEFMEMLSSAIRYYMHLKMNEDPGWQGIKVILSDATVPGEGEHKIMSYIRLQRNLPGFNPNTRHCLYGLDADLIMLALATHEIHFSILREDIRKIQTNSKRVKKGEDPLPFRENVDNVISRQKFQFLNIWVLRDYLAQDLRIPDPAVNSDVERLIDDFVFMCLFVGNDFLPHVPSLEISEGAIDLLMFVYKKEFVQMGGYLTNSFEVNLDRVEQFVQAVGLHENAIFRKRSEVNKQMEIRFRRSLTNPRKGRATSFRGSATNSNKKKIWKSPSNMVDNRSSTIDKVKLGEEGYKERYYTEKFEVKTAADIEKIQRHAVMIYIEGICWVMHYYYQGVCSWQWFYPYHYAPFASDFYGLNHLEIHFTLGKPFKPFDQLMGVLPAASAQALPLSYRKLMTDPSSAILDFYPSDFELDMNGKRLAWQAICKLPFIDESRLLSEIMKVESTLTDEEKQRNSLGLDILFVHITHPLALKIFSFCERNKDNPKLFKAKVKKKINPKFSDGMNGFIYISDKPVSPMEIFSPVDDMEIIINNKVISVLYQYPSFHSHIPKPPEGVIIPGKFVSEQDLLPQPILWHEKSAIFGRKFSERPPNPKSIWGHSLAKLAHRLVSEYYFSKQQQTMDGINSNCINGEDSKWKCGKDWDEPMDNKIKKNNRKPRKRTKPRAIKDVCTEGYFDWKERMVRQSNGCDGPMDTKDDDPTENKIQKKREKLYKSNFAEQQATTDGTGNYINSEDRMKQQCNDCDGPMDTKGHHDQTENKIQKKRKKRRKSKFAEQQVTTNGIVGNYINGEDRMKQPSNDCDDPKFAEQPKTTDGIGKKSINDEDRMKPQRNDCDDPMFAEQQNTTDGVGKKSINDEDRMKPKWNDCDDPKFAVQQNTTDGVGKKSINDEDRMKPQWNDCDDPKFAEQQNTTDGVGEKTMKGEDRMKPQWNDCDDPKFAEQQNTTDGVGEKSMNGEDRMKAQGNDCNHPTDNIIGNKKRRKRRGSKFAEQQATTDGVGATHINGDDRIKPQGDNCGSSVDNKTKKKKRKKCQSKFEEKQSTVDGVGENWINGEEKMKQLSNNCDDPTDNKIEKKRKKRRIKKRKIEANVEKGNEAEVMESLLTDSAILTLSADSSSRKFCLQDIMGGGTINQQKCLEA